MAVLGLNHINIRTLDIAGTAQFYCGVLGFRYDGPEIVDGFARNWLHDREGRAIIHLRDMAPGGDRTGAVDHVALTCDDMPGVIERLNAKGISFAARDNPADRVTQMFVTDPNGVVLELNFPLDDPA